MFNCTLVKINRDSDIAITEDVVHKNRINYSQAVSIDLGWGLSPLKTIKIKQKTKAFSLLTNFVNNPKTKGSKLNYGVMIHKGSSPEIDPDITLVYINDDEEAEALNVKNPIFNRRDGIFRNITSKAISLSLSPSMQSQLFAMLDLTSSDKSLMNAFNLKDKQQKKLYEWEQAAFPRTTTLNPFTMRKLMKNILNRVRLPWITLTFEEDGPCCKFVITSPSGSFTPDKKDEGDGDSPVLDLTPKKSPEDIYDRIGVFNDGYRLRISDIRLVMMLSWGMSESVIIHELSHYVELMTPSSYRINRGEIALSFNEYEDVFAGHGAAFVSIYARLLIEFYYVDKEWLYSSLSSSGLSWFKLDDINAEAMNLGIKKYILNKRKGG